MKKKLPHDTPAFRRFCKLNKARAKIELAVLAAMPLVFTEAQADELVLRKDYSHIMATWKAIDEATKMAYIGLQVSRLKAPTEKPPTEGK